MLLLTRLIELLFVNRRLKTSRPYVFSALTGFSVLALLGVFGTFLCTLIVAGSLWIAYAHLAAAHGVLPAALMTLGMALLILILAGLGAVRIWQGVSADIERALEGLSPPGAPLIDRTIDTIGDVAAAFRRGLTEKRRHQA